MRWQLNRRRVRAVFRKELRDFRHNGNVIYSMAILPLIFLVQPVVQVFTLTSRSASLLHREHSLLYMLAIPVLVPATLAAYSIVGERVQGTLEPLLTTPVRREELLAGKALAAFVPSVSVAYVVFGLYLAVVELFAKPGVASAVVRGPDLLAQLVFTPFLALLSIWIGMAVSARARDPRTAMQFAVLLTIPIVAVTSLTAFNVIPSSPRLAVLMGVGVLVLTRLGGRLAGAVFDREKLITGTR